eukprot:CAMPEP_0170545280 /NCGR_PEP_ID=MMETSP0211-20121228/3726_1 /TAXON_ID=311385 /ORGANISM="Pseudokeronopsis sp., Strain OXSARD2" /LENGTH=100 /DNA_ID=CAMNT_0010849137 /DNA_START=1174 /DNA_END=1473 /DNA_ORIENTATION=+
MQELDLGFQRSHLSHIVKFSESLLKDVIPEVNGYSGLSSSPKAAIIGVDLHIDDCLGSLELVIFLVPEVSIRPLLEHDRLLREIFIRWKNIKVLGKELVW